MQLSIKNPVKEYDIIIAGCGPAGCAAAIAAARMGAEVLILEATGCLGGMATSAMVSAWAPYTDKQKVIYRSIPLEILKRYKERVGTPKEKWDWVKIDPEALKVLYDEMIEEAGAKVLFQSTICDALVEDGNISCLIVANKAGLTPYKAKVYIDCTGDGDVATYAGVPFQMGNEEGHLQPGSLCFAVSDIHLDKIKQTVNSNPTDGVWARVRDEGKYPLTSKHFIPATFGNTIFANAGHLYGIDATDPQQLSDGYTLGRKIAQEYMKVLKEYWPEAFCDARLTATAPLQGVRESRRIEGEYCFTIDDYIARRSFPDEIGRNCYFLDCHGHSSQKNDYINYNEEGRNYKPGESHGIPWRCLVPKVLDNLLVAGRCISMDRRSLASLRVMPNCLATGEAAGIGAALAVKQGIGVHAIDAQEVISHIKNDAPEVL